MEWKFLSNLTGINRLDLPAFKRFENSLRNFRKIRDHRERLREMVVLFKRYKVKILVVAQSAYVFRGTGQRVICGNGDDHRALIAKMALNCHADGCNGTWISVEKSRSKFFRILSRTGRAVIMSCCQDSIGSLYY